MQQTKQGTAPLGPAWFEAAKADLGVAGLPGQRHNPRIVDYFRKAGWSHIADDETAWCAAAMCTWLEEAGNTSPRTVRARDFLKYGDKLDDPVLGCIAVFSRGNNPHQGHVGFFVRYSDDLRKVLVLGGNQSNSVSYAWFPVGSVLGFRWPQTVRREPPPLPVYDYVNECPKDVADKLRAKGSRIVTGADKTEAGAKGLATLGITSIVSSVMAAFTDFYHSLAPLIPVIGMTMLGTIALAFAVYTIHEQRRIRDARVEDDMTGRHTGRRDE